MVLRVQAALPTRLKVRVSVRGSSRAAGRRSKAEKGKESRGEENEASELGSGDSRARSIPRGVFRRAGPGDGLE